MPHTSGSSALGSLVPVPLLPVLQQHRPDVDLSANRADRHDDRSPDPAGRPQQTSPRIIACLNQKGGVGKTTTTVNLAAALAAAGRSVLLIDLDPQSHLTLHLGIELDGSQPTVYDVMTGDRVTAAEAIFGSHTALSVMPAEVSLAGIEAELAPRTVTGQAQRVLADKLRSLLGRRPDQPADGAAEPFDYVLIDCPPSLGLLTVNALTLASEVIVPMQAQFLSLQGLTKLFETVRLVQQSFNPDLVVSGIVLCMHEPQTILAGEVLGDVKAFLDGARGQNVPWRGARVLEPPIRRNIKLAECPGFGQTIFEYAPQSHGAQDYAQLGRSVLQQERIPSPTVT